LDVKIELVGE